MRFFLKAEPRFDGKLRIKEWYELPTPEGNPIATGLVDEDIRREYAREYAEFVALVDANQEQMYDEARAEYLARGGQ